MIRKILVFALGCLLLSGLLVHELLRRWEQPLAITQDGYSFTIQPGASLGGVARDLVHAGIMDNPYLVTLYARWSSMDGHIKQGEYRLLPGTTAARLLEMLYRGEVVKYQVTFPEGITLSKALAIMAASTALENTIEGPEDLRILQLVAPYQSPEGLFFPDTYVYTRGSSDWDILQRAHKLMLDVLEEEWRDRNASLPYQNPYEALIMASIVERETGVASEREEVAGVFVRRLVSGMLLQTDPTVIYGLGSQFDGNLQRKHLSEKSNIYNTYAHPGLPPSPIALPGRDSIRASLHPSEGDALYFVARGDGGHEFSSTLPEHNRAVRKYQLQRRKDYRSAPGGHNE